MNASHIFRRFALAALTVCLLSHPSFATIRYFDDAGGPKTWDTATTANWATVSGGPYNTTWATFDEAVFEGTGGTVNLSGSVFANRVTFNSDGYVLSGATLNMGNPGGANFTVASTHTGTIASTISQPYGTGLNKVGSGTLKLEGSGSTVAGNIIVDNGTLQVAGGSLTMTGGSYLLLNNSGSTPAKYLQTGGTVNLNNRPIYGANGGGATSALEISGGSLTGVTQMLLGTRNATTMTISGTASITMTGEMWIGYAAAGSNFTTTVNMNGGTFNQSGQYFVVGNTTGASGEGIFNQTGGTYTYTGVNGSYIGNASSGKGTMTVSGGTFTQTQSIMRVGQNGTSTGELNVGGGAGIANVSVPTLTFGANSGSASGTVNLLANGILTANAINKGPGSGTFNFNGGTLKAGATGTLMSGLSSAKVESGGAFIDVSTGITATISQALLAGSPSGGLTKNGAGTLTLTGVNTYSGGTTVNNGTLIATVNTAQNSIGTGAASIASGTTLQMNNTATSGTVTIGNTFTGGGTLNLNFAAGGAARNTFMSNVGGFTGAIQLSSSATTGDKWSLNGAGAAGATVEVGAGTQMYVGSAASTFAGVRIIGAGSSENRGAIRLEHTLNAPVTLLGDATLGGSGAGAVNGTISTAAVGTSILTIGAPSQNDFASDSFKGVISNGVGTLAVQIYNGNSGNTFILGSRNNTYSGGTTLLHSGTGTRLTIGSISGTPYGSGAITIGQANTDKAGIYFTTANQTLANAIVFNTGLGTDRYGIRSDVANVTLSGKITANLASATFSSNGAGGALNLTGQVTGAQGLILDVSQGAAGATLTVTLNNATLNANNYQGDTVINRNATSTKSSTLRLGAANQIPNGAGRGDVVINTNGTGVGLLNLNGFSETINGLSGNGTVDGMSGAPTLTIGDNNAASTFSGVIQNTAGSLALTKIGGGNLTFSGVNTYTGGTTVNAGTLTLGHATNTLVNAGTVTVNGGTLALGANSDTVGLVTLNGGTISGTTGVLTSGSGGFDLRSGSASAILGGALGVTKSTVGVVTLSGDNTYSGTTNINAGTLLVNGHHTGAGAVNVAAAGTLGGSGSLTGDTTIAGTLSPGNSPGTITFHNNLTLQTNAVVAFDPGDLVVVGSLLTMPTDWTLALASSPSWQQGNSTVLFDYGSASLAAGWDDYANILFPVLSFDTSGVYLFNDVANQQIVLMGMYSVPEPSSFALLGVALLGAGWLGRKGRLLQRKS